MSPPKVKALMVRVPVEFWIVVAFRVAVSRVAEAEAVAVSKKTNWLLAPWKSQRPVTASFWEREAGPPLPQSRLIVTSAEPEAAMVNLPASKESEEVLVS